MFLGLLSCVIFLSIVDAYPQAEFDHIDEYDDETIAELVNAGIINSPLEEEADDGLLNGLPFYSAEDEDDRVRRAVMMNYAAKDDTLSDRSKRQASSANSLLSRSKPEGIDGCPPFFVQFMNKCYLISNFVYDYKKARMACQQSGADLVAIENVEEDQFLIKTLRETKKNTPNGWWTSGHSLLSLPRSRQSEQQWLWQSTNRTINYSRWYSNGHPKYNVPCVSLWRRFTNFEWASTPCNTYLGIICEKDVSY